MASSRTVMPQLGICCDAVIERRSLVSKVPSSNPVMIELRLWTFSHKSLEYGSSLQEEDIERDFI